HGSGLCLIPSALRRLPLLFCSPYSSPLFSIWIFFVRLVALNPRSRLYCDVKRYRSGNTLRFPRARDEPPHSQRTLAVGSHRLRFPAGVFVCFLRYHAVWQQHCVAYLHDYDACLQRSPVGSFGTSTCMKTPQSGFLEEAEAVPAESNGPQRKTIQHTSQCIDFVSKTTFFCWKQIPVPIY